VWQRLIKQMKALLVIAFSLLFLVSCDSEDQYDVGYSDGHATGYNTTCNKGYTSIWGRFDDEDYARGYADGQADGVRKCLQSK
jgi:hypothetical protein